MSSIYDTRKPDARDACCWPRRPYDFDAEKNPEPLTREDAAELLKLSGMGVRVVLWFQTGIFIIWCLATGIPGFVLYDGTGGVNAYSHFMFWPIVPLVAIICGYTAITFNVDYLDNTGRVVRAVDQTAQFINFYMFVLFLSAVSEMAHLVLTAFEYSRCDSTLCSAHQWAIIVLIVALFIYMFIDFWAITRAYNFQQNLKLVVAMNMIDLTLLPQTTAATPTNTVPEETQTSISPALMGYNSQKHKKHAVHAKMTHYKK
jgi:hypothetical protein